MTQEQLYPEGHPNRIEQDSQRVNVGKRSRNSKFSYAYHQDLSMERPATSRKGREFASTYPCRSLSGSVQVNGVDGVVLVVIQITDDQVPNGRHLRVQHTYSSVMSPTP